MFKSGICFYVFSRSLNLLQLIVWIIGESFICENLSAKTVSCTLFVHHRRPRSPKKTNPDQLQTSTGRTKIDCETIIATANGLGFVRTDPHHTNFRFPTAGSRSKKPPSLPPPSMPAQFHTQFSPWVRGFSSRAAATFGGGSGQNDFPRVWLWWGLPTKLELAIWSKRVASRGSTKHLECCFVLERVKKREENLSDFPPWTVRCLC